MTKFGLVSIVAGALSAAVVGLAAPAQADGIEFGVGGHDHDYGHHHGYDRDHRNYPWRDQLFPQVKVPHVDTTVRN